MISGLNLAESVDYVLKDDKDNPTVWKLGVIPSNLFALITTGAKSAGSEVEGSLQLLQAGLKGWENLGGGMEFRTVKEKICGIEAEVVPMELVGKIPLNALVELANKVLEINQQGEPERKN